MKSKRQLSFKTAQKQVLDFKIKLRNDGLSHTDFLREVLAMYINADPVFESCITQIMNNKSRFSASRLDRAEKSRSRAQKNLSDIIMTEEEKKKVYSLLEQEVGEL